MPKRKKVPRKTPKADPIVLIETALAKLKKAELVTLLVHVANEYPEVRRDLESELKVVKPVDLLLADITSAIFRATDIEDRMVNHNFDYDYQAYKEIKNSFKKLIALGQLDDVKNLALQLMEQGSYQVECSDEGMMTDDIEACLKPVIRKVASIDRDEAKTWAAKMISADRVGFICGEELEKLMKRGNS